MPAIDVRPLLTQLNPDINTSSILAAAATNTIISNNGPGLQVICAWPVSGQYGPGSRALYYVLVAACVLARKSEFIKNACLTAALLFPAVAALHGIVLAALHKEGAVDMDIFGSFQLCAIGILVGPVTVWRSRTYFNDPGRNTIFVWAGLILAGLLSLTVEFYRIQPQPCTQDNSGNPVSSDPSKFVYSEDGNCNLTCSVDLGPFSPMRTGSANNIYVIPIPDKLPFGTATLLAAACSIHATIWLVTMMDKVLEINWKSRFGVGDDEHINDPISGTNGATKGKMRDVNEMIRLLLSVAVVPVFGGAAISILVIGERNFFSRQVRYQNEPMASIGQWGPIVGTGLACFGSLYLVLAENVKRAVNEDTDPPNTGFECESCAHHFDHQGPIPEQEEGEFPPSGGKEGRNLDVHLEPVDTIKDAASVPPPGSRRKVTNALIHIGNFFGTAAHDWSDVSEFRRGQAANYPEVPGERFRNADLPTTKKGYDPVRDADGNASPNPSSRQRGGSFVNGVYSGKGFEDRTRLARTMPAKRRLTSCSSPSHMASPHSRQRAHTLPAGTPCIDEHAVDSMVSTAGMRGRRPVRRETLKVPEPVHHHEHHHEHQNDHQHDGLHIHQFGQASANILIEEGPSVSPEERSSSGDEPRWSHGRIKSETRSPGAV